MLVWDAYTNWVHEYPGNAMGLVEFFAESSCRLPDLDGPLYLKVEGKKSWHKFHFTLRLSGLYYNPKGKGKALKDLVCFQKFDFVEIYMGRDWKKKYKAPSEFCFALKHPQIQKKTSKYSKYFCAEDSRTLWQWVVGIRMAKYGQQLRDNFESARQAVATWDPNSVIPNPNVEGFMKLQPAIEEDLKISRSGSIETISSGSSAGEPKIYHQMECTSPSSTRSSTVSSGSMQSTPRGSRISLNPISSGQLSIPTVSSIGSPNGEPQQHLEHYNQCDHLVEMAVDHHTMISSGGQPMVTPPRIPSEDAMRKVSSASDILGHKVSCISNSEMVNTASSADGVSWKGFSVSDQVPFTARKLSTSSSGSGDLQLGAGTNVQMSARNNKMPPPPPRRSKLTKLSSCETTSNFRADLQRVLAKKQTCGPNKPPKPLPPGTVAMVPANLAAPMVSSKLTQVSAPVHEFEDLPPPPPELLEGLHSPTRSIP